jgi:hypothetical protein
MTESEKKRTDLIGSGPERNRRMGKVFEGILFLMFLAPALFVALTFDVVPIFGGRVSSLPANPGMLTSRIGYGLGLGALLVLCFCAVLRIFEGVDAQKRLPYQRLLIFFSSIGASLLVAAVIMEVRNF